MSDDRLDESIARLESEPTSCPCACHQPKHEARPPSPLTMIGRVSVSRCWCNETESALVACPVHDA